MDETKRVPPAPDDSAKAAETPSFAPSKEKLAMIQRAALAMADRNRAKPAPAPESQLAPPQAGFTTPEPPEPFIVKEPSAAVAPKVTLGPPASPPTADEAKLIAEFNALLDDDFAKLAALNEAKTGPASDADIQRSAISEPEPTIATAPTAAAPVGAAALRPLFDDQFRLSLTRPQSAAAALGIVALALVACGLVVHTWVAAHDWSCRTGMLTKYCQHPVAISAPQPAPLPEIPI